MTEATAAPAAETLGFKAEVRELLKLMIHSLYSHREIFLRELISNASDANDKLRFLALSDPSLADGEPLGIWIDHDEKAGTLAIRDNGVGLTREEAVAHLGTIAKSGTAEFFSKLTGDAQKDSQLIGQFGVGFYSAFIVADQVEVLSRKAGAPAGEGVRWRSSADGEFTVETIEHAQRGTTVILHLKEDAKSFADPWRLRGLVRRYSDHIAFPVHMRKSGGEATLDYEVVNQAQALWTRPRTSITDDEYKAFYKHITHDGADPLAWSHNKVEGKREYTSLLYLPAQAPFDLYQRDAARGLKLHVRRVFIMDDAEQFLPLYLRFIKGVLDSSDLPLNVSRELLQSDPEVEAMRGALTKRALDLVARLAKDEPEKYAAFWKEFGQVLKEGVGEDPSNRDKILPLLRFASTAEPTDDDKVSLADYVARMKDGQKHIYYVLAESRAAARSSPSIEALRARGVEVLLLGDRVDQWIVGQFGEFDGKRLQDAARGDLDLGALAGEGEKPDPEKQREAHQGLLDRLKGSLGDQVEDVRPSQRLTESPSCLVRGEHELSEAMRRMLSAAGRDELPVSRPVLEVNVSHPLVARLEALEDGEESKELAQLLFDQAQLGEQGQVANPGEYLQRLNRVLVRLMAPSP